MNAYPDCIHKDSLEVGAAFQDFVMETLMRQNVVLQFYTSKERQYNIGESMQGWEVNLDNRFTDTGRLSIEIAEKTAAANTIWVPSGIYRNDNTWLYIHGNYEYFFVFLKKILIGLHKSGRYEEASIPTLRKFYLPISDANKYAHVIRPGIKNE